MIPLDLDETLVNEFTLREMQKHTTVAVKDRIYYFIPAWYCITRNELAKPSISLAETGDFYKMKKHYLGELPEELDTELRTIRNNIGIDPSLQVLKVSNQNSMFFLLAKEQINTKDDDEATT